jgi:hypothetical protein
MNPGDPTVLAPEYTIGQGPYFPTVSASQIQSPTTTSGLTIVLPTATAFPAQPVSGQIVWRTDLGHIFGFYNGAWVQL